MKWLRTLSDKMEAFPGDNFDDSNWQKQIKIQVFGEKVCFWSLKYSFWLSKYHYGARFEK